ncbi:formylglycine-generating enzyme family protein [candidate division KSB1 bacterium]|nr:formylglycine-generating enzyme family protein [candidate division KSB1 bacterium]
MLTIKHSYIIILLFLYIFGSCLLNAGEKIGNRITNSINIQLVFIPAGSFLMGSPYDEPGRQGDEFQHNVTISRPFYISVTEITQAQWMSIMEYNRSQFRGDNLPVEKISWKEAVLFCQKLSEKEDRLYRLPTEAEWEYACCSGGTTRFVSSEDFENIAWYANNSQKQTHPVGIKQPNVWGLYDMIGNVSEWCSDYYVPDYPEQEVSDPGGPVEGRTHVIRGGAWDSFLPGCRCTARSSAPASYQFKQTGFRIVLKPE